MEQAVPILSLIVALLAVFVGPLVSWLITKRQLESAERIAARHIVSPMRQTWVTELRQRISELAGSALHYFFAGFEDRSDAEYRRLTQLEQEVTLMLSPEAPEHQALMLAIREMLRALSGGKEHDDAFIAAHAHVTRLGRDVLRAEWRRVKTGF